MLLMVLGFSMQAQAALELRGVDSLGNRLIYDIDFDITWYDYSSAVNTWQNQMNWADALSVSGGDLAGVYDDWRLPTSLNQDSSGPCYGYNCTGSEMGHLFYTELGNLGQYDTYGNPTNGYGLSNTGDFQNLQSPIYWSSTERTSYSAWLFNTKYGGQGSTSKELVGYALAVRFGDVSIAVVPEPVSMVLFGIGGVVMGTRRMVRRRRG